MGIVMIGVTLLIALIYLGTIFTNLPTEQDKYNSNIQDKPTVLCWDIVSTASMYHVEISYSSSFDNAFFNVSDVNEYNYPEQVEVIGDKMYFIPYPNQRISHPFHWHVRPYVIENPGGIV